MGRGSSSARRGLKPGGGAGLGLRPLVSARTGSGDGGTGQDSTGRDGTPAPAAGTEVAGPGCPHRPAAGAAERGGRSGLAALLRARVSDLACGGSDIAGEGGRKAGLPCAALSLPRSVGRRRLRPRRAAAWRVQLSAGRLSKMRR